MAVGRGTGGVAARPAGATSSTTPTAAPYPLRFGLYEDGHRYDAFAARFDAPMLVFQGTATRS